MIFMVSCINYKHRVMEHNISKTKLTFPVLNVLAALLLITACAERLSDHDRGLRELDNGNLQEAIVLFTSSIEKNTDLVSSFNHRGLSYLYLGEFDQSVTDFSSALELEQDPIVFHNRALAYKELGHPECAFADLDMAGRLNETDLELFLSTGYAMLDLGFLEQSESVFNKAINVYPTSMEAYNGRGNARIELGDIAGAEADWDKAVELSVGERNR